jgi:hypothetical protein
MKVKNYNQFINENVGEIVMPNNKLLRGTGYGYANFYVSTQAENILVDFQNPQHLAVIKLLADQQRIMDDQGELPTTEISKGKRLIKKVTGFNVVYSKYYGADVSMRLSTEPSIENEVGKKEWIDILTFERYV